MTIGDTCIHAIHLPESQNFESISIPKPSSLPEGNGYQIKFDIYYPSTNEYDLTVRFYKSSSEHNSITVTGSDNIQSITITNDDFYRLEMFTRENVAQTEYWVSNVRCNLI